MDEDAPSAVFLTERSEFVSVLGSLKKGLKDVASEKSEWDGLFAAAKLAIGEHKVVWTNV